jgi:hypothetical protein
MAFADIQDVRLAGDANSYCGSGMARCPVKDFVPSAYVAGGRLALLADVATTAG